MVIAHQLEERAYCRMLEAGVYLAVAGADVPPAWRPGDEAAADAFDLAASNLSADTSESDPLISLGYDILGACAAAYVLARHESIANAAALIADVDCLLPTLRKQLEMAYPRGGK